MPDLADDTPVRKPISKGLRFDVLNRDGFRCVYCGATPPDVVLHIDHRVAVVNGGTNDKDNLVSACLPCKLGKSAKRINDAVPLGMALPFKVRPRIEFFWKYDTTKKNTVAAARCVEWLPDETPYGGYDYHRLCKTDMSTHGHSTRGFSPYEASMYAVELLTLDWSDFGRYVAYIDDLNLMAEAGHIPQYVAPQVMRALHPQTVFARCLTKPPEYEALADNLALQSQAAFANFIASQHTLWAEAR